MEMFKLEDSQGISKHRDYEHTTFAEHEFDNGAQAQLGRPVMCNVDPITENELNPSKRYFVVDITLHTGKSYLYLVPAEADGSEPNRETVKRTMNDYAANPIPGGRDALDYIDEEETSEESMQILVDRFAERLING